MRRRLYQFAALFLAPLVATGCPKDKPDTGPEGDTDADTDADTDGDVDTDATDYGVPPIRYLLSGSVTDAATGDPVTGIELSFQGFTAQSTKEGVWSIDAQGADYCGEDCTLWAADVDGEENGEFEATHVTLTPTQTAGHSPDEGIYEQFDVAVPMTRLDSDPDDTTPVEEP